MTAVVKLPKTGTRRRAVYDLLMAHPDEWLSFDPTTLGYESANCHGLWSDLRELRNLYNLDIRTNNSHRQPGVSCWRYVPLEKIC
jgi:hypothetical protein